MLLLVAEKPEDVSGFAGRLDAPWHFSRPEPHTLAREFETHMPEAVILAWAPGRLEELLPGARWLAGRAEPVVVYAPDTSAPEIAALAEIGLHHFRFGREDESEWNAYLYALKDQSRRAGILSGTHSYLETLGAREIKATREILESFQFGMIVLDAAAEPEDCRIRHVNSVLEILMEVELGDLTGYPLATFLGRRSLAPEIQRLFTLELPRTGQVLHDFLPAGEAYFERTVLPLFEAPDRANEDPGNSPTGYLAVFHDVTYEIESGRRDLITGFAHRDEAPRLLARRLRWIRRRGGVAPSALSVGLLELADIDIYRERHGPVALEDLLNRMAGLLRRRLGETELAVRIGISEFVLLLANADRRRCENLGCDLLRSVRGLEREDGREQTANLGIAFRTLEADDLADEITLEGDLARWFKRMGADAESALRRALQEGPGRGALYSANGGYHDFGDQGFRPPEDEQRAN